MPAYYISTGDLNIKVIAKDKEEACIKAFDKFFDEHTEAAQLGIITMISEKGFKIRENSTLVLTKDILDALEIEFSLDKSISPEAADFIYKEIDENNIQTVEEFIDYCQNSIEENIVEDEDRNDYEEDF